MGSCMSHLPFHAGGGRGPKSITWTPAMPKYNSRVMHMIKKRQMLVEAGDEGLTAAAQFYALAA
jgi:hypothetical protein